MKALAHRNQEIGVEIKTSHRKSTETRSVINRNPFSNQQKLFEVKLSSLKSPGLKILYV